MKNVAAYIRVSTDGQLGEDKFGLDAQREQIIEYCKKNDMNIIRWFSDEGESGAKWRPGFDEIVFSHPFENGGVRALHIITCEQIRYGSV